MNGPTSPRTNTAPPGFSDEPRVEHRLHRPLLRGGDPLDAVVLALGHRGERRRAGDRGPPPRRARRAGGCCRGRAPRSRARGRRAAGARRVRNAAMSLPCGAPRTARSTASVSGRSRSSPSRTPGGGSFTFGRPWASMQGCISKPGAGVGAQGAVVGRGEDDRAAAAAAGVLERALEQRAADPARLVVGQHDEQRQPPHALAVDGKRRADHLPVLLGHPRAARIGLDQVAECAPAARSAAEAATAGSGSAPRDR